ncbi:hypothetical protein A6R68_02621 [Neotoma lepida]|uniref:SAP domain-containing protein n=1 Tax=Neotoma lepida TaxID=56216 RepID=A0A1A6GRM5_NEOLE|nr:hypothetical protein A6R68_02621 [Neotoma lepida]
MSGWESYYKTEGEEEEEEEESPDPGGEYKYSGRDSLIFLVDASRAMFESQGAKRVLELDQFKGQQGKKHFQDTIGHGADYSLSEVLWVCANLFSDVQYKMSHKRIMLFTNEDDPHGNDSAKASRARTKARIFLDLMHLKRQGGFDISLFYRDIISIAEDEDLGVHFEESSKLEDLLRKVRAKETKKRVLSRLRFNLGKDVALMVGIYNLVQKANKPFPVRLYRETNEPVKTKTRTFNTYGSRQIVLEKEETEELKRFDEPGLILMGFKPSVMLKKHHYLRPSLFVYPEESLRKVPFTEKVMANPEQIDKMKAIVQRLRFTYRSDSFENPVEAIKKRLGSLADEFKELVYPPDYNPEGKVTKRKQDDEGSASKKPKVELSEEELKVHFAKGTLGKLTVPALKEVCKAYGLKSGPKKQELLDALTRHFQKN